MIKFQQVVILLVCLMLIPTFCWADESGKYEQSGFYAGVGGLYAIENLETDSVVDVDNAAGFNFRIGYRLAPHWAIEAMVERVDEFDLMNAIGLDVDTWTGTLNGKFFVLTNQFQPYGLFGIGVMRMHSKIRPGFGSTSITETDMALRFGGGIDSYITEHWVVNTEVSYVLPTGDVDGTDYVSLGAGIQYRF